MPLTLDRSIVTRFSPANCFIAEYLAEPASARWAQSREEAHVFYTHADAERWAKEHPYLDSANHPHCGWALVCGTGDEVPRREELPSVSAARAGRPVAGPGDRRAHIEPEEAYELLEKRGLA